MPVGATLGAAAISAGASIYGTSTAANDQKQAAAQAMQYQQPYVNAGDTAIAQIDNPNTIMQNYQQSPGFQWGLQQGENAVNTSSAMNGLLRSGGAVKALDSYATGAADQDFNNWFGQQESMANLGSSAAANASNIATGAGKTAATAAITQGSNVGNTGGALASMLTNPALASMFNPAAGGATSYSTDSVAPGAPENVNPSLFQG